MKLFVSALFVLSCLALVAQNDESKEEAKILHEEGMALLQKTPGRAYYKLQALEKFIQSQKRLLLTEEDPSDLYKNNEIQLQSLSGFFGKQQNSDSLLQLTRFFPDSIFQRNASYSIPFKLLVQSYLDLKKSATRIEFFRIRELKIPNTTALQISVTPIINFENYWPLEVIEFEEWLEGVENTQRSYPEKARNELLQLKLQSKLDSLTIQENASYYERSQNLLREAMAKAEQEREAARAKYQRLINIGLGILVVILIVGFLLWKKNNQLLKSKNQLLLEEKKHSEDLLFNMLPAEVVRQLKQKGAVKAHRHEAVSVLFSDFCDFSQIAETLTPEELIGELGYCFSAFDHIIEKYRLQKIKTIGDAYMCVGGLYTRGGNHVQRMVAAALEIQQFLINRKTQSTMASRYFSDARIGIHVGPIVAGVVGMKKIAFDVWGDTVNVAQQMEQRSENGKVNISADTYELIKDKFECVYRGKVIIKNKKEYDMYFVIRGM